MSKREIVRTVSRIQLGQTCENRKFWPDVFSDSIRKHEFAETYIVTVSIIQVLDYSNSALSKRFFLNNADKYCIISRVCM